MPTADEYRQSADDCVHLARDAKDPKESDILLRMAEQWGRLADYKAQQEKPELPPRTELD